MTFRYRGEHRQGTVRRTRTDVNINVLTNRLYLGGLDDEAAAAKAQEMADQVLASWSSKIARCGVSAEDRPPVTDEELGEVAKEIAP